MAGEVKPVTLDHESPCWRCGGLGFHRSDKLGRIVYCDPCAMGRPERPPAPPLPPSLTGGGE